jgi:hypothetical protein
MLSWVMAFVDSRTHQLLLYEETDGLEQRPYKPSLFHCSNCKMMQNRVQCHVVSHRNSIFPALVQDRDMVNRENVSVKVGTMLEV